MSSVEISPCPPDRWLCTKDGPVPTRIALLGWQRAGRSYTATGYGRRIPSRHQVQLPGSARWRRVYVCCFGNAGTAYVEGPPDPATNKPSWIVLS